jgi:ATP-dependent helicase/nuclease subunit A
VVGHPGIGDGDSIAGRIGTLVHTAIQHNIDSAAVLQRFDRSLDPDLVQQALITAKIFRQDVFFARFRAADVSFEVPITHRIAGITITGRVDLLGPDFILDFKTGRRSREAEYLVQLWLYAEATNREEMSICYFDGERPTVRRRSDMIGMREEVDAVLKGIKNREFAALPDPEKCSWCRYKSICPESAAPVV